MPSLYEIEQAMLACVDMETGEVLDAKKLDSLQMERTAKLESVTLWIKNLLSDVEAYEKEIATFVARKKTAENKIESLKNYLAYALNGEKFSTSKCTVSYRKSQIADITDEAAFRAWAVVVAPELLTIQEPKINKNEVKRCLKDGESIPGAVLVERQNIQIK